MGDQLLAFNLAYFSDGESSPAFNIKYYKTVPFIGICWLFCIEKYKYHSSLNFYPCIVNVTLHCNSRAFKFWYLFLPVKFVVITLSLTRWIDPTSVDLKTFNPKLIVLTQSIWWLNPYNPVDTFKTWLRIFLSVVFIILKNFKHIDLS